MSVWKYFIVCKDGVDTFWRGTFDEKTKEIINAEQISFYEYYHKRSEAN